MIYISLGHSLIWPWFFMYLLYRKTLYWPLPYRIYVLKNWKIMSICGNGIFFSWLFSLWYINMCQKICILRIPILWIRCVSFSLCNPPIWWKSYKGNYVFWKKLSLCLYNVFNNFTSLLKDVIIDHYIVLNLLQTLPN